MGIRDDGWIVHLHRDSILQGDDVTVILELIADGLN
jgi:hypothetical protein